MPEPKYSLLPTISVNRPVTVLMGLLMALVLGIIAYNRIPIELMPSGMEEKRLMVRAYYQNSTPLDVLDKIVEPMEDALGTVSGVEKVYTRSYGTQGRAYVYFHKDVDMDEAYAEIKDRMDRVLPEMPEEVDEITVYRYDEDDEEVLFAAMTLGDHIENPEFFIERYLRPALQRIDGVGDVDIKGTQYKEVRISLDQEKLRAHNVDINRLTSTLKSDNLNLSAGRVREGGQELMVRSVGRIEDLKDLEDFVVDRDTGLRLSDLGEVYIGVIEGYSTWRLNGGMSYGVEITRSADANIVEICDAVVRVFDRFSRAKRWGGIDFHIFQNQGAYILESVSNLKMTAIWGGIFSFIVLICFLRSLSIAVTIAMAIPLSLLCSIIALYFMGWTMNVLTMMGLLLAVGLVVDNAIVMVENIYSKREEGMSPKESALFGASEIGLAITMATLTTAAVFIPLLLMRSGSETHFFFLRIGIPVIAALGASLGIALLLIPLASKTFAAKRVREASQKAGGKIGRAYQLVLRKAIDDRYFAMLIIFSLVGVTLIPIQEEWIDVRDGRSKGGYVYFSFELPGGVTKDEVEEWTNQVETFLEENRELYVFDSYSSSHSRSSMYVRLNMIEETETWYQVAYAGILDLVGMSPEEPLSRGDIMRDFAERFNLPPGLKARYRTSSSSDNTRSFYVYLYGDDTETLFNLGEEVVRRLQSIEELVGLDLDVEANEQELGIHMDREKAQQLGISTREVSSAISSAMRGSSVGRYYMEDGREIDIDAGLREEDRESLTELNKMRFKSDTGKEVPLDAISKMSFRDATQTIRRYDRKTNMRIRALMETEDTRKTNTDVESVMQGFEMPRGYKWDRGGSMKKEQEENQELQFALVLIFVFVIFLMGVLFESFIMPLAVIITVPIAGIGVVWMLVATDTAFDRMAGMGAMILIGVVVNNGIVLVDLSQRLMASGMSRNEALMKASRRRFRPIWVTSLTTMCGMIPIAIGGSKMMDISYAPLGRVVVGGLMVSTFLALIIVPTFYAILDDMRNWFANTIKDVWGRKGRKAKADPV
jgi:HAE1 family hydrophobic/amphiphilic exporter-1